MNFLPKGRNSSRKVSNKRSHSGSRSRSRSFSKSRSRSGSRSPRGRRRHIRSSKSGRSGGGGVDSGSRRRRGGRSRHRPGDRVFSRSLSRSPTSSTNSSTTSSSTSRSRSRSYSSYSRSSSSRSSSSSSSFSSSSTGSVRSPYRKRSYSRATKSWSRSPSAAPRPPPPKIKATSLSKAVQSVHSAKDKKFSKPVTAGAGPLPPDRVIAKTTSVKMKPKAKPKPPRTGAEAPIHSLHGSSVLSPPGNSSAAPEPTVSAGDFYNKEVINPNDKAPPFVEAVDKASFKKMDVRRGPETQYYKGATQLSREVNTNQPTSPHSDGGSNSDSSTDEEEGPMKMTLSERFGKLAQLSSQRQEYDGVRMKIVREGGQDKKVYLERDSRSSTPRGRRSTRAHERWLREHKEEYDEYEERYGEFRHWDPHRDLPRELPPNWEDVNVRYRYYKESGYFGERSITMEDYLKWEEWWYRYRDWLEKYGGAQEEPRKYRGPYTYEAARVPTRDRWIRREKDERKRHHY